MPSEDQFVGVVLVVVLGQGEDVLARLAPDVDAGAGAGQGGGLAAPRARRRASHSPPVDGAAVDARCAATALGPTGTGPSPCASDGGARGAAFGATVAGCPALGRRSTAEAQRASRGGVTSRCVATTAGLSACAGIRFGRGPARAGAA